MIKSYLSLYILLLIRHKYIDGQHDYNYRYDQLKINEPRSQRQRWKHTFHFSATVNAPRSACKYNWNGHNRGCKHSHTYDVHNKIECVSINGSYTLYGWKRVTKTLPKVIDLIKHSSIQCAKPSFHSPVGSLNSQMHRRFVSIFILNWCR